MMYERFLTKYILLIPLIFTSYTPMQAQNADIQIVDFCPVCVCATCLQCKANIAFNEQRWATMTNCDRLGWCTAKAITYGLITAGIGCIIFANSAKKNSPHATPQSFDLKHRVVLNALGYSCIIATAYASNYLTHFWYKTSPEHLST